MVELRYKAQSVKKKKIKNKCIYKYISEPEIP